MKVRFYLVGLIIPLALACSKESDDPPFVPSWEYITSISNFSFSDKNIGYTYHEEYLSPSSGVNINIKKTINGGINWLNIYSDNRQGNIYNLFAMSQDTCYALSNDRGVLGLLCTFNGGTDWSTIFLGNYPSDWTMDDKNNIVVAVSGAHPSRIIKIKNNNVELLFENDTLDFKYSLISFPNSNDGYIMINDYQNSKWFLYTHNSFADWTVVEPPDTTKSNDMIFISNDTGYLACDNGLLFKTNDGGKNWIKLISNTTENLNYLHFVENVGYCVGNNGTILRTYNGTDWQMWETNITTSINKIQMFDTLTGYLATNSDLYKLDGVE